MAHLYHMVPEGMVGENLIPLDELQELFPPIYEREIKKYNDHPKRKGLPKRFLKKIDCFQESVLHFSPVHPHLMFMGLRAVYFDMNKTGSYVFGEDEPEEMFELFTPESYKILTRLPDEALDFYRQWKARGERSAPAMGRIPHVMVKGRVNIANCAIIDWKNPQGVAG